MAIMGSAVDNPTKGGFSLVLQNPYLCGVASVGFKRYMCLIWLLTLAVFDSGWSAVWI